MVWGRRRGFGVGTGGLPATGTSPFGMGSGAAGLPSGGNPMLPSGFNPASLGQQGGPPPVAPGPGGVVPGATMPANSGFFGAPGPTQNMQAGDMFNGVRLPFAGIAHTGTGGQLPSGSNPMLPPGFNPANLTPQGGPPPAMPQGVPGFKKGGRVKPQGDAELQAARSPEVTHHNPKMKSDEPAKLAVGGMSPLGAMGAMPPTPPGTRNTMTPKRTVRPRAAVAAPPAMPVPTMKKGGAKHKDGGAIGHLKKHMKKGEGAHPDEDADDFNCGGAMKKKHGGRVDPAEHNAKVTDSAKHGTHKTTMGSLEQDGGFKRGGSGEIRHKYAKGGEVRDPDPVTGDQHRDKHIGENGEVVKGYKGGGAVKGHHDEGHRHMHEVHGGTHAAHHGHGHTHMVHAEKKHGKH